MRLVIRRLGRFKLMLIITALSVMMSIALNLLISGLLYYQTPVIESITRAAIIPLLIAPVLSWYLLGLLVDLDKLEAQMNTYATYDDLTGLYNRRSLFKYCHLLHRLAMRTQEPYCIAIIDLDLFKRINDQYGHATGDAVLKSFGGTLKAVVRECDIAGRMGGEEFCIYLSNTKQEQVEQIISRLNIELRKNLPRHGHSKINYTISTGVAERQCNSDTSFEDLLKKADIALYAAKNRGRNQTVIYSDDLKEINLL